MKRKSAFTLTELLVVIAVIAMLLAILVPSLSVVRQSANKITCLNNLKQLGITVYAYTQQYKVYPVCISDANATWDEFLADPDSYKNKMLGVPASLWPFHKEKKLYDCPMLTRKGADISYCYDSRAGRRYTVTETASASVATLDIRPKEETKFEYDLLVPDRVRTPKTFVILYDLPVIEGVTDLSLYHDIDPDDYIDSENDPNEQGYLWQYEVLDAQGPHAKGFDILFADGHVKYFKQWSDSDISRKPN